jgi:hypothetical protein
VIGLLLAGAVALVGCSRYDTAREGQGKGHGSEVTNRSFEQGGWDRNSTGAVQESRGTGGFGRRQDTLAAPADPSSRRGGGLKSGQLGRGQGGRIAEQGSAASEQSGKSVVETGTLGELSGTLAYDGSEWYLETGSARFILHFGNSAYVESTGIDLREGETIDVRGFVSGEEIAVAAARTGDGVYTFRSEDGRPLWAGNGRRDNQIVRPYEGKGTTQGEPRGQGGQGARGRGQGREESQELPWWYQQPEGMESPRT